MTTISDMTQIGVIIAATAGSVIGAMILYSIGLTYRCKSFLRKLSTAGGTFYV